jgi:hypothetical protein
MRTEDLIADLASRATPVRPLPSPALRTWSWLAIAFAFVVAGLLVFGARADLGSRAGDVDFLWLSALAAVTMTLAGFVSLELAVPGAERSPLLRGLVLAIIVAWSVTLAGGVVREGHGLAGVSHWYVCFVRIAAIGLPPGIALFVMLRRAAPLRPGWTAALALGAAAAAGALAIQFVCPIDDAGHGLIGHLGAVVASFAAGAVLGRRALRHPESLHMKDEGLEKN